MRTWGLLFSASLLSLAALCPKPNPSPTPSPEPTPTPTATPTPAPTPEPAGIKTSYFFATGKYGDFAGKVPWAQVHYAWAGRQYAQNAEDTSNPSAWIQDMRLDIITAIGRGQRVYLALGRELNIDPNPVLDAAATIWPSIERIDLADEPQWDAARLESETAWIKSLIEQKGLYAKPIGVIATPGQVMEGVAMVRPVRLPEGHRNELMAAPMGNVLPPANRRSSLSGPMNKAFGVLDFVAIEAYFSEQDADGDATVRAVTETQLSALGNTKAVVIGMAYTRNGTIQDPNRVANAWLALRAVIEANRNKIVAVNWFSLGRPTGLETMAQELGPWVYNWQKEIAEALD